MQRCLERQPNIYFNKNLAISKIGHFISHVYSDKESDTFTCFQEWSILGWKVTSGQLLYTPLQTACDNQYLTRQFVLSHTLPCNVYINNNCSNKNQLLQKTCSGTSHRVNLCTIYPQLMNALYYIHGSQNN